MDPKIENRKEENGEMTFTLKNVDTSIANALRRTILVDIPILVFRTTPHSENKCNITKNTTKLNDEIIKHRLSCIPICLNNIDAEVKLSDNSLVNIRECILEVDKNNTSDMMQTLHTGDFKIKHEESKKYVSDRELRKIFPPFNPDGNDYFIDLVRLSPKISDALPGEAIAFPCSFDVGTAKEYASFNVAGTCSYGCTVDAHGVKTKLDDLKSVWKSENKSEDEIEFEAKNWKLLDGMRHITQNSFDFILNSVGIYSNQELVVQACDVLVHEFTKLSKKNKEEELNVVPNPVMQNGFDITLEKEDHTIGNIISWMLMTKYFGENKYLTFCGIHRPHPHVNYITLRIAFSDEKSESESNNMTTTIRTMIHECIEETIKIFNIIRNKFDK